MLILMLQRRLIPKGSTFVRRAPSWTTSLAARSDCLVGSGRPVGSFVIAILWLLLPLLFSFRFRCLCCSLDNFCTHLHCLIVAEEVDPQGIHFCEMCGGFDD